ncbi:MAG: hypothetical protein PVH41_16690, partial [Anaerolineae bacterium]
MNAATLQMWSPGTIQTTAASDTPTAATRSDTTIDCGVSRSAFSLLGHADDGHVSGQRWHDLEVAAVDLSGPD